MKVMKICKYSKSKSQLQRILKSKLLVQNQILKTVVILAKFSPDPFTMKMENHSKVT